MQELSKYKVMCEQLTEYKAKWIEKLDTVSKKCEVMEKENAEWKEKYETEVVVLSQTAEMATLDKEMAEEKVSELEIKVEDLTDQLEG